MLSKHMRFSCWLLSAVVLVVLLSLVGHGVMDPQVAQAGSPGTGPASWSIEAKNENPGVLPPNSNPFGKSYGEWSAAWWQWAYSLPVDQNPFFDEGGNCSNGANGQSGPVWFLTGVINVSGTAVRNCNIPAGKALFFPILNVECATLEGDGSTEEALRACTSGYMELVTNLAAEIDGVSVQNLDNYRAASPLFTYGPLPANSVPLYFGKPAAVEGATSLAAADGFYLMLAPLSEGEHTIHFTGTFEVDPPFTLDITYHLTVEPGPKK